MWCALSASNFVYEGPIPVPLHQKIEKCAFQHMGELHLHECTSSYVHACIRYMYNVYKPECIQNARPAKYNNKLHNSIHLAKTNPCTCTCNVHRHPEREDIHVLLLFYLSFYGGVFHHKQPCSQEKKETSSYTYAH